jgi:hypothetical protein
MKLIASLQEAKKAAQELGISVSDMGFDDALADAESFKNGSLLNFEKLQEKILHLSQALETMGSKATNVPSSATLEVNSGYI